MKSTYRSKCEVKWYAAGLVASYMSHRREMAGHSLAGNVKCSNEVKSVGAHGKQGA